MFRGPMVMDGYYGNDEATRASIEPDGWLHSGDIATIDEDGYFTIVDRKTDMILTAGYNVYPAELERVLCMHPAVALAAVTGVPDEVKGELAKAYVVRKPGHHGDSGGARRPLPPAPCRLQAPACRPVRRRRADHRIRQDHAPPAQGLSTTARDTRPPGTADRCVDSWLTIGHYALPVAELEICTWRDSGFDSQVIASPTDAAIEESIGLLNGADPNDVILRDPSGAWMGIAGGPDRVVVTFAAGQEGPFAEAMSPSAPAGPDVQFFAGGQKITRSPQELVGIAVSVSVACEFARTGERSTAVAWRET